MKDKKNNLQRILVAFVALLGFTVSIVCFIWRLDNNVSIRSFILAAVYYCFIFVYGFYAYKTPHGNMVRYLLLTLALYIAFSIVVMDSRWSIPWFVIAASNFAAVLIAYMAGRLNKVKKNIIVAAIVSVLLLVKSFWPVETPGINADAMFILDRTMPIFMWLTVVMIYFFRFKEHKQAGITADSEEE